MLLFRNATMEIKIMQIVSLLMSACVIVLFFTISMTLGAALFFHYNELRQGQFLNMLGLCLASQIAWIWTAIRAKEDLMVALSMRNAERPN